jgi:hypothetical protein
MQHSAKLREQLEKAAAELESMERSKTLDELETHWKEFLSHIERFWYKSQAHFGRSPKWTSWGAKYQRERENDPLLKYLRLARGAHEHTLDDIAARQPGTISIGPGPTGSGTIRNLTIDNGQINAEVTSGTISITVTPDRVATLPIKQRGGDCPPPTTHLGQPINPENVVALAKAGHAYYKHFLAATEGHLVANGDV